MAPDAVKISCKEAVIWRQQTDREHWYIWDSFGDFLLSLASKLAGAHEAHAKHISFRIEMVWLIDIGYVNIFSNE